MLVLFVSVLLLLASCILAPRWTSSLLLEKVIIVLCYVAVLSVIIMSFSRSQRKAKA